MGTLMEYIDWRGDLNFTENPLNDVDTLIFSMLSYLPYKGIVPGVDSRIVFRLKKYPPSISQKTKIVRRHPQASIPQPVPHWIPSWWNY